MNVAGKILAASLCFSVSHAIASEKPPYNDLILQTVQAMPSGGGYATNKEAFDHLQQSMSVKSDTLEVHPEVAQPSFCSSSTYLVFLKTVEQLQKQGKVHLKNSVLQSLLVDPKTQSDGVGVWGRWNANGPGTARLFSEMKLGSNFTDIAQALPGDFMKIFWSDEIGAKEKGHSVIFMGTEKSGAEQSICYWSSNQKNGMGKNCVAATKIHRMLFSRLESPQNLGSEIPKQDSYLSSLLTTSSNVSEMCAKVSCAKN